MSALFCLYFLAWLPYVLAQVTCQDALIRTNGIVSNISHNGVPNYFVLEHGSYLTYTGPPELSIGMLTGCYEEGEGCTCEFTGGSEFDCGNPRNGYVAYKMGAVEGGMFTMEMPACTYFFTYNFASPSLTPSQSGSSSETPSPSISPSQTGSASISPSETPSSSISPSQTGSPSISSSETPSPSITRSQTKTSTRTPTNTATPSETPVTICQRAIQYYHGSTTYADAYGIPQFYILNHGTSLYHISNPNILIGTFSSCAISVSDCVCTYNQGSSASCPGQRVGYVTYRMGATSATSFTIQNPTCIYYFLSTIYIPPTPSRTPTPSATPSTSPEFYTELLTDSATDIGVGAQGERGWAYMYLNSDITVSPLSVYVPGQRSWEYPASYCVIRPTFMHTNDAIECAAPDAGYCAPRAIWTNHANRTYDSYHIEFSTSRTVYNPPVQDGATITLRANEEELVSYGPTPFTVTGQVLQRANISTVDITLYPGVGCNNDGTQYSIQIYGNARYPSATSSPSASESASQSPSGTESSTPSVSKTASSSPSRSGSSSVSGSATSSRTRTPTRSRTRSVSRTRTPSASGSPSVSGEPSVSSTPLGFVTGWPTMTPTAEETPSETPALMMSRLPSPFTYSPTPSEQFIRIPYSRVPSPLSESEKEQIAQEQEAQKETMKATAMAGTAVGVAATAGGVAVIAQIMNNVRVPNNQGQQNQNDQQDEQRRRRPRRPRLDSDSEEESDGDNDDDDDDDNKKKEAVASELSPQENVTITPVNSLRPGLLKKGLTRDTQQQDSSMSILSYYFPAISSIINDNHYFKYSEQDYGRNRAIQNDIHTRYIDNNMYISIISKRPVEMSDIVKFIENPIRPCKNIVAMYNHETGAMYGECIPVDERRMKIRPFASMHDRVLEYTTM